MSEEEGGVDLTVHIMFRSVRFTNKKRKHLRLSPLSHSSTSTTSLPRVPCCWRMMIRLYHHVLKIRTGSLGCSLGSTFPLSRYVRSKRLRFAPSIPILIHQPRRIDSKQRPSHARPLSTVIFHSPSLSALRPHPHNRSIPIVRLRSRASSVSLSAFGFYVRSCVISLDYLPRQSKPLLLDPSPSYFLPLSSPSPRLSSCISSPDPHRILS